MKTDDSKIERVNHASVVANYDFNVDREDGNRATTKIENYSHICSSAVAKARAAQGLTQAQLASKVNEKPSVVVELENGQGRYSADLINRIERVLKV